MNNLFNIKDYVVVITGGTGVLGRTIAKYLAQNGAKVIILGRKEEVGNQIIAEIKAEGLEAEFMKTDVLNQDAVQKNCDDILAKYGRIDTLLNAAGGNMPGAVIAPDGNFFDLRLKISKKCSTSTSPAPSSPHRCSSSLWWHRAKVQSSTSRQWQHSAPSPVFADMPQPRPASATSPNSWPPNVPRNLVRAYVSTPLHLASSSPNRTGHCSPIPMAHIHSAATTSSIRHPLEEWATQKNSAAQYIT